MNNKAKLISAAIAACGIVTAGIVPAFAQNVDVNANLGVSAGASTSADAKLGLKGTVKLDAILTRAHDRADMEIKRRIDALTSLEARINDMEKVTASEKTTFNANIKSQIDALTALQAKIAADVSANATSTLKTDLQSITGSYRIFALILPQGAIEAASDRGMTIVSTFQNLGTQLQARITAAQASGTNVTAFTTAYADFTAKVSDAQTNLSAATTEVASLTPDNGDKTKMAANTAALKDARAKIQAANKDFVAARADAQVIMKATVSANATTTTTTTP